MAILDEERVGGGELSGQALQAIKGLAGWKMFVSILFIVITSLGLLGVLGGMVSISSMRTGGIPIGAMIGVFIGYGIALGIGLFLYIVLLRSANKFNAFLKTRNMSDLEQAFALRRKFWMIAGILLIAVLVLYALLLVISIFGAGRF